MALSVSCHLDYDVRLFFVRYDVGHEEAMPRFRSRYWWNDSKLEKGARTKFYCVFTSMSLSLLLYRNQIFLSVNKFVSSCIVYVYSQNFNSQRCTPFQVNLKALSKRTVKTPSLFQFPPSQKISLYTCLIKVKFSYDKNKFEREAQRLKGKVTSFNQTSSLTLSALI